MSAQTLRNAIASRRAMMWLCLGTIALSAWIYLASNQDAFQALCRALPIGVSARDFALVFSMWLAMGLAMMLPSATPMIDTYLDIADAAAAKSIAIVPAPLLVAGYCLVWLGFAVAMTFVQFEAAAWLQVPDPRIAGAALIAAGLYQFTPLKHACLTKCRAPMPYFLRRWSDRPHKVLLMGVEQGALCLGCCWALMALALVTGFMNLAWMAAVAAVAILEKLLPEPKAIIYGCGIGLIGAGGLVFAIG
jgi:predicted metal-binding membrane protein